MILMAQHRFPFGGGRVVQWCWVNFQCRGVLLIWIIHVVGQRPTALAVGAGGGCLDIFSLLSPSLWGTARYRRQYCLKGSLSPKQPTNQQSIPITNLLLIAINKKSVMGIDVALSGSCLTCTYSARDWKTFSDCFCHRPINQL